MPPCMAFSNENPLASSPHDEAVVVVQQVQPHSIVPGVVIYTQRILVASTPHLIYLSFLSFSHQQSLSNEYVQQVAKKILRIIYYNYFFPCFNELSHFSMDSFKHAIIP